MPVPLMIENFIEEMMDYLDPNRCYKDLITFQKDHIQVGEFILPVKNNLFIFGIGKSSSFEVKALRDLFKTSILSKHLKKSYSMTKVGHTVSDEFKQWQGDHPLITKRNIQNSEEFVNQLKDIGPDDSLVFLTSGGSSSLLEIPRKEISFEELQREHQLLLDSGLNINEMNKRRKELSLVKGGGLLDFIQTPHILQFITCDIPNEEIGDVGSGPLISDNKNVMSVKTQSGSLLLERMCVKEDRVNLGIFDGHLNDLLEEIEDYDFQKGLYYISGGEATVTIENSYGLGGRNTHFVLSAAHKLYQDPKNRDLKVFSIGTDGSDGPTDAAGAYIDYNLYQSLECIPFLKNFDSYHYFEKLGSLIKTGPTKTNVMDIRMIWRE